MTLPFDNKRQPNFQEFRPELDCGISVGTVFVFGHYVTKKEKKRKRKKKQIRNNNNNPIKTIQKQTNKQTNEIKNKIK